ncbi:hypothetical protein [Actinoalloteichus caeruleus]|uniref:hypothetical protein n=1 Tax=Actinoalloteichus cyanogriseus TaxID=2893586 RepID=UPI000A79F3DA|nr:hypothetical protein [Actinoalloteichus caeruleus]
MKRSSCPVQDLLLSEVTVWVTARALRLGEFLGAALSAGQWSVGAGKWGMSSM